MGGIAPAAGVVDAVLSVEGTGQGGCTVKLTVCDNGSTGSADIAAVTALDPALASLADGESTALSPFTEVLDRRAATADREAIGRKLFEGLIHDDVLSLWQEVDRLAAGRVVRIRLDVRPLRLRALPWELMRSGNWVCLRENVSWWRGADPQPPIPEDDEGPLRVLLVVCNPLDRRLLADEELTRAAAALADQLGRMHVEILDGPSRPGLGDEIDRLEPHVLHFIGHGMPRLPGESAALAFNWVMNNAFGNAEHPDAWELRSDEVEYFFRWKPRLVVVNACRTAADPLDQVGGFVEAFLTAGVRAVVSMQADVESPAAARFSAALYEGLGTFKPIDRIIADSRLQLVRDTGDNGEWALPVLQTCTDPADALRIRFAAQPASISQMCSRTEYRRLRLFLGRSCERRKVWWALDPKPGRAPAPPPLLVIGGRSVISDQPDLPTGTTWLTHWCLFTYFLRGYRVTYVDLAEPLRYQLPGRGETRKVLTKDWLDVIRVIREACAHEWQPEPLPAEAFSQFNFSLNGLVTSRARPSLPAAGPISDEWQPFNENYRHVEDRTQQIFTDFLTAMCDASGGSNGRPHVIALDHVHKILDEAFDQHVYPRLIRPVAEGRHAPLRFLLVTREDWIKKRLPAEMDESLRTSVPLGGFESDQFMRLAQDYCRRRNLDFARLRPLFDIHDQMYRPIGAVPVTLFDDIVRPVPGVQLGSRT